ncbi:hypothetical protein OG401_01975 [Kitasatospora purpeofusca]|uniref:hypothetical protein n=1 Tax=Kitasatospora purpeofusca TaxID=67352 RepID=UPI00225A8EAE|nr:hypothetical protein [Kitasatospora purpeofusca]MCX4683087.1 hypothetical protein [Kitasatospora purpeofusca]
MSRARPELLRAVRLPVGEPLAPTYRRRSREQRRRIQLVPQNPLGALNPARTVGATLARPLKLHFGTPADRCEERVAELLTSVGLTPEHADTVLPLGRPGPEPHGRRDQAAAPVSPVPTVPDRA